MRIILDSRKTLEQNAALYFERAKKARRKLEGAKKAIALAQERIKHHVVPEEKQQVKKIQRKQEWYEKLRWSISSDGFLLIGGRDAATNELVVKKHADKGDIIFHTDMAGSPFIVVKADGKEIPVTTLEEAAQLCVVFSRGWKLGMASLEAFYVAPDQLSKTANTGEFVPKGAFIVRGSVKYLQPMMEIAIGKLPESSEGWNAERFAFPGSRAMVGHPRAVMKQCGKGYLLLPGNEKSSDVAKQLEQTLDVDSDEIVPLIPPGGVKLGKQIDARTAAG